MILLLQGEGMAICRDRGKRVSGCVARCVAGIKELGLVLRLARRHRQAPRCARASSLAECLGRIYTYIQCFLSQTQATALYCQSQGRGMASKKSPYRNPVCGDRIRAQFCK